MHLCIDKEAYFVEYYMILVLIITLKPGPVSIPKVILPVQERGI